MNLIIQPEAGLAPVVRAIQRARRSVDIAIFRTDREEIEKALGAAVQRGVKVRVLVAHTNRGGENRLRKLEQRLLEAGATVTRTGDTFSRYHGKFLVADDTLHLFGFNFTRIDTSKSRSFGVSTRDAGAVREALALFEADCSRQPYVPKRTHLVVSPENAREMLTSFIQGAKRQLLIYDVNIQDRVIIKLLQQQAAAGVDVRVIGKCKGCKGIDVRPLRSMRLRSSPDRFGTSSSRTGRKLSPRLREPAPRASRRARRFRGGGKSLNRRPARAGKSSRRTGDRR